MHNSIVMKDERVCDPKVKDFIRTELKNNVKREYPIVEFVKRVWKFDPSAIPQTRADGGVRPMADWTSLKITRSRR